MIFEGTALDDILDEIRQVAVQAGELLLDGLDRPKQITHKGSVDLVTQYDRQVESFIRARLEERFPQIGMLAEEGGETGPADAPARWIVDPVDGTTNYAHGQLWFAVSIGLEAGGRVVAGAVSLPAFHMVLWARDGGGAFCNDEPIRVSKTTELDDCLLATGFPYDRRTGRDDNTDEHRAFIKSSQGVRRCGSAVADLALLARGVYDGFWEPRLHAWDLAAGTVLVREAGGTVTDYQGNPIDIHEGWIVASNGLIHDQMLDVIRKARSGL